MLDPFSQHLTLPLLLPGQAGLCIAGSCLLVRTGTVSGTTPSQHPQQLNRPALLLPALTGLPRIRHNAVMLSGGA